METVEKFMQSFFEERTSLARVAKARGGSFVERYYAVEYLAVRKKEYDKAGVLEKIIPSVVLKIEIQCGTATVITLESDEMESKKHLYKLRLTSMGWQIDGTATECVKCGGSGVFCGDICSDCEGKRWCFYYE